ncbi:RpiB/LacA/LacB family sugar-phosphate isomerase [uncultured Dubosiella sp.]|uniref:RpiB/LacA/LacB family sugar-phosphate isomerase n=1 Tax=uncultured Dubosiella sp. TaxID=1937011 RepID=UPI00272B2E56|nr:RpiB/LacA/LacB family sugar-phosphate isomerase [uncultured Dubosiella sp.]
MRIALINENSQASKNAAVERALKKAVAPYGYEVVNYGMFDEQDEALTYVQNGILAAILLNSGAADYVVTGCGTGQGAMLACNAFPGVLCGHIEDPLDAYTFAQINDGNAIALPFAKGFGWGGDLNLEYIFEKLFCEPAGQGYPRERAIPEQRNKQILDQVKAVTCQDLKAILPQLDAQLVQGVIGRSSFQARFFQDCASEEYAALIRDLIQKNGKDNSQWK